MRGQSGVGRRMWLVAMSACAGVGSCADAGSPPSAPPALGEPLAGLSEAERARFLLGKALFERLATPEEGLGPLFNAERCSSCHDDPVVGGGGAAFPVLKATRVVDDRCDLLTDRGGDNIQRRVTPLLAARGVAAERVPDASEAEVFVNAPPLFGVGLLEAVPTATLAELADPEDVDGDGVSGRLPRRPDGRPARFGRKGDAATLREFVDMALRFELGLTTPDHPVEERPNGAPLPAGVDPTAEPEIDARGLALLTDYVRLLAPPAPADLPSGPAADRATRGARIFGEVGCATCHVPELQTGPSAVRALHSRLIRPYSDLLLHDLGRGSGDVCGLDAAPGEYRTAPLWGLRHRSTLLHDGSARDLEAAIASHGGEAAASRDAFHGLAPGARGDLIRFLESL